MSSKSDCSGVEYPFGALARYLLRRASPRRLYPAPKTKPALRRALSLEQGTGVEPALTAWEAAVIPIYQPCICLGSIAHENAKRKGNEGEV